MVELEGKFGEEGRGGGISPPPPTIVLGITVLDDMVRPRGELCGERWQLGEVLLKNQEWQPNKMS